MAQLNLLYIIRSLSSHIISKEKSEKSFFFFFFLHSNKLVPLTLRTIFFCPKIVTN
jgi:hypothetical protein